MATDGNEATAGAEAQPEGGGERAERGDASPAAPPVDADGRYEWEQPPEDGYPASTTGGDGPADAPADGAGAAEGDGSGDGADAASPDDSAADGSSDGASADADSPDASSDADASAADDTDSGGAAATDDPADASTDADETPDLEATADAQGADGNAPPPYYVPPNDTIDIGYTITVRPPPADRAEATVHKHATGGDVLDTLTLVDQGSSTLSISLTDRTVDDSPLFVELVMEKEGAPTPRISIMRAFSLAEPEVKTIDASTEAKAEEDTSLKVGTWGALAYDRPGHATWFADPEVDPAKVSDDQKGEVRWKVDGHAVASLTGDDVTHQFPAAMAGRKVVVEAARKRTPRARLEVRVGKLEIKGAGATVHGRRPAAPRIVPLGHDVQLKAYLDPAELAGEATFEWTSSSDKVTLAPGDAGVVTATGATESDSDDDVTLTVTATVNSTSWTATTTVSVRDFPRIKARDGTSDPTAFAPQWHYVYFKAVVPEGTTGTYRWQVSGKLQIMGSTANRQTVTVMARQVSDAVGDQWVKVTFTPTGGAAMPDVQLPLTAFAVVFSADPNQKYGFDAMEGVASEPPRLSVKKDDSTTVRVNVRGPGVTSDQLTFTSDNTTYATVDAPDAGQTEFTLTVHGGSQRSAEAPLRARLGGADGMICATLTACVYKEFKAKATLFRVEDPGHANTRLRASFSVSACQDQINEWYKTAVIQLRLRDGGAKSVAYDLNANGKCELGVRLNDPRMREEAAVIAQCAAAEQRIILLKKVEWRFTLTAPAPIGANSLTLDQAGSVNNGDSYDIIDHTNGNVLETVTASGLAGSVMNLQSPTTVAYATGDYLEWGLAGRSGDPAWIQEGRSDVETACTAAHELGHSLMRFLDLDVTGLFMYYAVQNTRRLTLRYKSIARHYSPPGGTENQWNLVPRTGD